jgi:hypothetical protein
VEEQFSIRDVKKERLQCGDICEILLKLTVAQYRHAPHNKVSVFPQDYNNETYHYVTIAYSVQYSNTLYRLVA